MSEDNLKIALVTGCSSGIGLETALELGKNGYRVYATMRDLSKKNILENQKENQQLDIQILELDVSKDESVKNFFELILEKEDHVDVLINNAGYGVLGALEDLSLQDIKQQFETDFFGPVRMMKNTIPLMKKQNYGKIISVSSLAGKIGFGFMSAYVASKFALEGFHDSIRQELLESNIHMSIIEPGAVNTKFAQNMLLPINPELSSEKKQILKIMKSQTEKILAGSFESVEVAKKIILILNEDDPKPRYLIGRDAERIMIDKNRLSETEFEQSISKFFSELMEI